MPIIGWGQMGNGFSLGNMAQSMRQSYDMQAQLMQNTNDAILTYGQQVKVCPECYGHKVNLNCNSCRRKLKAEFPTGCCVEWLVDCTKHGLSCDHYIGYPKIDAKCLICNRPNCKEAHAIVELHKGK